MKRRSFLQSSLGLGAMGVLGTMGWLARASGDTTLASTELNWRDRDLMGFGTMLSLRVAHSDAARAEQALDAAVATIRHVEAQMSLFLHDSAISGLNRDSVLLAPDQDLVKVLQLAQSISARSQGAFDVTVQPLWNAFETAQRRGTLPSSAAVATARGHVGWQGLRVSADEIRLRPGMGVTLNGIAQGYAADLVKAQLQAHGIQHALINTGEWVAFGHPSKHRDWVLGVADPRQEQALITRLAMDGRSIATSADNECTFSEDRRYNHIFDPHTGYSPTDLSSVTVAAPSCALADGLTKVMFVAGRQALQLARQWQVDVLIVDKAGNWQATEGLRLLAA